MSSWVSLCCQPLVVASRRMFSYSCARCRASSSFAVSEGFDWPDALDTVPANDARSSKAASVARADVKTHWFRCTMMKLLRETGEFAVTILIHNDPSNGEPGLTRGS